MTDDDRQPVILDIDHAPDPGYLREVLHAVTQGVRVANHQTADRGSLPVPADVHAAAMEVKAAAELLPQLLAQLAARLEAMHAAGEVAVTGGDYAGRPDAGVAAGRLRLDMAAAAAMVLRQELGNVTALTTDLAAAGTGEDGGDE